MIASKDPRIVVPVDPQARQLIVFEPVRFNYLSGWAIVWTDGKLSDQSDVITRMRFGFNGAPPSEKSGALVIRELYLTAGSFGGPEASGEGAAMSGRFLRNVPLARFEAAVNTPQARSVLDPLLVVGRMRVASWPDEKRLTDDEGSELWWMVPPRKPVSLLKAPTTLRLDVPKGYGRPDSFYRAVADVYSHLTTMSTRPANELAEANDVPVTTVHGWVKEARKRGFLPAHTPKRGRTR